MALPEEYKVIRKVGLNPPNIVYLISRSDISEIKAIRIAHVLHPSH